MSFIPLSSTFFSNENIHSLPVGTVIFSSITVIPDGWKLCDGSELSVQEYPSLFNLIKHKYGGEGSNFKLPNLIGKVIVGEDKDREILSEPFNNTLSTSGGEITHILTLEELATHSHIGISSITGDKKSGATVNYSSSDPDSGNPVIPRIETTEVGNDIAHNNMQPYFIMNFIIKVRSTVWKETNNLIFTNISFNNPIGSISPCATLKVPDGWLLCDGKEYSRSSYPELSDVIESVWGGDLVNFRVPDLRGRALVGADSGAVVLSQNNTLGTVAGNEKHSLTFFELPEHSHTFNLSNTTEQQPYSYDAGPSLEIITPAAPIGTATTYIGSGAAHNNLQPYAIINYIIKAKNTFESSSVTKSYEFITTHSIILSNLTYFVDASQNPVTIYLSSDYQLSSKVTIRKIDISANTVTISDQSNLPVDFSSFYSLSGSQPITILKTDLGWIISQL